MVCKFVIADLVNDAQSVINLLEDVETMHDALEMQKKNWMMNNQMTMLPQRHLFVTLKLSSNALHLDLTRLI